MKRSDNEIWVFLSHSNKDYEKVKSVRDKLEREDFRPIMFFLKCLEDNDEIDDLIKREIDARTRFILCDSKNARASNWVQKEIEYIKSKDRVYEILDIDGTDEEIDKSLKQFWFRSNVFISYSRDDREFATLLQKELIQNDYRVLGTDNSDILGCNIKGELTSQIKTAANDGYVIIVVSEESSKSKWVLEELKLAKEYCSFIMPIILTQNMNSLQSKFLFQIYRFQHMVYDNSGLSTFASRVVSKLNEIDKIRYNE